MSEGIGAPAPAAAPEAAPAAPAAPVAAPAPAAPSSAAAAIAAPVATPEAAPTGDAWYSGIDAKHHGMIQNRHWENMDAVLESYSSLDKLRGVSEDQLLRLPAAEDADGFNDVYNKLGRPETPEGYQFKKGENWSDEYESWYKQTVHDLGLNEKQAVALQEKHDEYEAQATTARDEQLVTEQTLAMKELGNEWGAAYDEKMQAVKVGAEKLGWSNEEVQALEKVVGTKKMMNTIAMIGESLGESTFHGGDSQTGIPAANVVMTREAAVEKYNSMKADPEFTARLFSKDKIIRKQAVDERNKVSRMAFDV